MENPQPQSGPFRTRELVARYLTGDTSAESILFASHSQALLQRARDHRGFAGLRRVTTPEDLVNEVFVRALSSGLLAEFEDRGRGSLGRLLIRILDRVVVDTYRRHRAHKRLADFEAESLEADDEIKGTLGLGALVSSDPTPTANARAIEFVTLAEKHLAGDELRVWKLAEVAGLDSESIAERVNRTNASVRGVLHRARKRLLRALAPEWDGGTLE